MSHDEGQEQPKREYHHHPRRTFNDDSPQRPAHRVRPESVTVFTVLLVLWNLFQVYMIWISSDDIMTMAGEAGRGIMEFALYIDIGLGILVVVGVWAVWNWKKWGYHILIFVYAVNILFSLCGGNIISLVINVGITFLVYKIIGDLDPLMD